MRLYDFEVPFEDEALETRAWDHYQLARDQGSHLGEDDLIKHCREIAHRESEELARVGEELVSAGAGEEDE